MPELPEAEITKRKLAPMTGKTIASFWSDWPRGLRVTRSENDINRDIRGRRIRGIRRHGKVIFFDLGERILAFHQRMSGRLLVVAIGQGIPRRTTVRSLQRLAPAASRADGSRFAQDQARRRSESFSSKRLAQPRHVHTKLYFSDGTELWFHDPRKFGVVWYGKPEEVKKEPYHRTLGPDGLVITLPDFKARLREHRGMIKPLLLRQDVVAGIGNIVADETLWEARVHPKRRVQTLKDADLNRLFRVMKNVFDRGIRAEGTTLRDWMDPLGQSGKFQKYFRVYGRGGEKCPRSRTPIKRVVVGGRGTWICPRCQRLRKTDDVQ